MRVTFIKFLVSVGALVYVSTELLSAFNLLTPFFLYLFWLVTLGAGLYLFWRNRPHDIVGGWVFGQLSVSEQIMLILCGVLIVLPLLFLAIYAPPNNVDSNNYHLTRVVYWLQNRNVNHFPTIHVQQLYHNVMSEYLLLHVLALSGHDYFVNVVQWGAMLGTVASVGAIAKQLGLKSGVQVLVSILQLTLPIGILEASTTQNDYVAVFFFTCFMYFGIKLLQEFRWEDVWWMSVCLALGGFTKYPVFFYAFPYCLWIGVQVLRRKGFKTAVSTFGIALGTLLLVFGPFFNRNYALFGSILSPKIGSPLFVENIAVEKYCFTCTLSNVAKNLGLHLGLPSAGYNAKIDAVMAKFHALIGEDINNPQLSLDNYRTQFVIQEDMSGNLLLLIAICIAAVWLLFQKKQGVFKGILVCAVVGFVIFCSSAKFQFWSSRTHMPVFAQGTLLVGLLVANWPARGRVILGYFFVLTAIPYIVDNFNKPLFPIRYASKYWLGYIPRHLCVPVGANENQYRETLGSYYDFAKPEPCYPLKQDLPYAQRQQIVTKLNALDYYKLESEHIFKYERAHYFFICDHDYPNTYYDFKELAKRIEPSSKGVGMLLEQSVGFYRYWSILRPQMSEDWQMRYIVFEKDYLALPNARQIFAYDYVLSDNEKFIDRYLPKTQIEAIYRTSSLVLVKLKKPSVQLYNY
jgi:hypothetical protein